MLCISGRRKTKHTSVQKKVEKHLPPPVKLGYTPSYLYMSHIGFVCNYDRRKKFREVVTNHVANCYIHVKPSLFSQILDILESEKNLRRPGGVPTLKLFCREFLKYYIVDLFPYFTKDTYLVTGNIFPHKPQIDKLPIPKTLKEYLAVFLFPEDGFGRRSDLIIMIQNIAEAIDKSQVKYAEKRTPAWECI